MLCYGKFSDCYILTGFKGIRFVKMTRPLDILENSNVGCCMVLPGKSWSTCFGRSLFILLLSVSGRRSITFVRIVDNYLPVNMT
jgi:hypothetical protein